jgi:hypothetical protein
MDLHSMTINRPLLIVIAYAATVVFYLVYAFIIHRKIILRSLTLAADEKIILKRGPYREKNWTRRNEPHMANYIFITSCKIVHLTYFFRQKRVQINERLFFEHITDIRVSMQHDIGKRRPLFYIAATKVPLLSIKTSDKAIDYFLKSLIFPKKKIGKFIECVKKGNANVNVSIDYTRDDLSESMEAILYEGLTRQRKRRLQIQLLIVIILLSLAIWQLYGYVKVNGLK